MIYIKTRLFTGNASQTASPKSRHTFHGRDNLYLVRPLESVFRVDVPIIFGIRLPHDA